MKQEFLTENCNAFLDEVMNINDLPGLAIGVSCGLESGHLEFTGARGYRDYPNRIPLGEDDIFHCASVSKLFTSSAILRLVETGALHLEDRLSEVLPDLHIADRRYEEIRLAHMLTHTSGLGDVSGYHWYDRETDADSLRRYVYESEEVTEQPMLWAPGEGGFRYSNIAYEILGQIACEYSGCASYEDFVAEQLLQPAGMTNSTMKTFERAGFPDFDGSADTGRGPQPQQNCGSQPQAFHMARPHEKKPDRSIGLVTFYPYTRQHAPSSTLTSTAGDLLRWGRAHLAASGAASTPAKAADAPLLKPETYARIWQPYATVPNNGEKMGLGWFMREQTVAFSDDASASHTFRLFGHEGTDDGFRASFWICPELALVTVVLSNLSGAPVKKINKKLFDRLIRSGALSRG